MDVKPLSFLLLLLLLSQTGTSQDPNCDYYQTRIPIIPSDNNRQVINTVIISGLKSETIYDNLDAIKLATDKLQVMAGRTYYIYSPNYPYNYTGKLQCRWIADCPAGYNCRLNCPEVDLPASPGCRDDRLLVSRTGDSMLTNADRYCGRGTLDVVSTGQRISVGLVTVAGTHGGQFNCQLTAQRVTTPGRCSCGEKRRNRIVGGQETGVNEFKMMAGLVDARIAQIKCGAVIISDQHVLTAAHCVQGMSVDWMAVVVGEHDVTVGDSPATKAYRIVSFTIHPYYSEYDYDIAIVTVHGSIEFNDRVGPVCLPFKFSNGNFTGSTVTILGWGTLFPGGPTSDVLRKVDVDVISQSSCRAKVPAVTDRQICTYTPGKDACQDDSGGPLLYTDPATGLLFNVGIVSYGMSCASDYPGVNTRVTALLNWVVANTRVKYCIK